MIALQFVESFFWFRGGSADDLQIYVLQSQRRQSFDLFRQARAA